MKLAQEHNSALLGFKYTISLSVVQHSTTRPPFWLAHLPFYKLGKEVMILHVRTPNHNDPVSETDYQFLLNIIAKIPMSHDIYSHI